MQLDAKLMMMRSILDINYMFYANFKQFRLKDSVIACDLSNNASLISVLR